MGTAERKDTQTAMATDYDSPEIWDEATRAARRDLTRMLVAEHPTVLDARVTCNQAPLQVQGEFADGRIFLFQARHGVASLAIAVPDQPREPVPVRVDCSDTLSVDDTADAAALFATLLNTHPDHP